MSRFWLWSSESNEGNELFENEELKIVKLVMLPPTKMQEAWICFVVRTRSR